MMGVELVASRNDTLEPGLDLERIAARGDAGPVAHAEDVGVDGNGGLAEGDVEDDIGGLPSHSGKRFQRLARARHLAAMLGDEFPRERDDVSRLAAVEADGADVRGDRSSSSAAIFSGVSAILNSAGVALLTLASVACAERTTAMRSVNGLL